MSAKMSALGQAGRCGHVRNVQDVRSVPHDRTRLPGKAANQEEHPSQTPSVFAGFDRPLTAEASERQALIY